MIESRVTSATSRTARPADVWAATQVGSDVQRFPKNGGAPESFGTPKSAEGLAVDGDNNVYVADERGRHQRGGPGSTRPPTGWADAKVWVAGGFQWPGDVEVSPDGTIYVLDHFGSPPPIRHFDSSGKLLSTIRTKLAATGGAGAGLRDRRRSGLQPLAPRTAEQRRRRQVLALGQVPWVRDVRRPARDRHRHRPDG